MASIYDEDGKISQQASETVINEMAEEAPNAAQFRELVSITDELAHGPIYKDSRAELLIDGPATFSAMLDAIASAKRCIDVETFIFADDEIGLKFSQALIDKSRAGVPVRVMYDSVGSIHSSDGFFESMQEAGIQLLTFNNINPAEGGNPLNLNIRDHRKLMVIDGMVAFTGGLNFSNTYTSSSSSQSSTNNLKDGWRDTHVAIYGPAVKGFQKTFDENWQAQGGEASDVSSVPTRIEKAGDDYIATLRSKGGDNHESPIYRAYVEAIDRADERIWITQAYFVPDRVFLKRLILAAQRGVDVRILVPGFSDSDLVLNASRSRYGKLLRKGIRIFESQSAFIHAKTAVIDGVWSTVGSSNLDPRSFIHNDEINAVILGRNFGRQMEQQFEKDIENQKEISRLEWKNRPLKNKIMEWFSRWLEYWI